ncbi:MAG: hypothetical protein ACREUF_09500, partial [Solimonas sp.]
AEDAGGLGTSVQQTADQIITATAFVGSAGDGVVRVFDVIANTLVGVYATAAGDIQSLSAIVAEALSNLPDAVGGEEFARQAADYRREAETNYAVAEEAAQKIRDALEKPLAGETLKSYLRAAREEAEAGAAEAIKARKEQAAADAVASAAAAKLYAEQAAAKAAAEAAAKEAEKAAKATAAEATRAAAAIAQQIEALQLQADTLGLSTDEAKLYKLALDGATESQLKQAAASLAVVDAFEKQKKAQEDYKALVSDLLTDEEKLTAQLKERLKLIESMPDLPEGERREQARRAIDAVFSDAPEFGGIDAAVGGPAGELMKIDDAQEELEEWYATQLELLNQNRQD